MSKSSISCCWITGGYRRRKIASDAIKEQVCKIGNCSFFYIEEEHSIEHFENKLYETNIFDNTKTRLFIIKDISGFESGKKANEKLGKIFSSIPDDAFVLVDGPSSSERPFLHKIIAKIGKVMDFPQYLNKEDAISLIVDYARNKMLKNIEAEEIDFILEIVGNEFKKGYDSDRIIISLDKIDAVLDGRTKTLKKEDISNVLCRGYSFNIYELFEKLDNKKFEESIILINNLIEVEGDIKKASEYLFSMLMWRYTLLVMIKENQLNNKDYNGIVEYFKSINKIKKEDEELKPLYSEGIVKMALSSYNRTPEVNFYTRAELISILIAIGECYFKSRHSYEHGQIECRIMMENIVMTICGIMDSYSLSKIRQIPYEVKLYQGLSSRGE